MATKLDKSLDEIAQQGRAKHGLAGKRARVVRPPPAAKADGASNGGGGGKATKQRLARSAPYQVPAADTPRSAVERVGVKRAATLAAAKLSEEIRKRHQGQAAAPPQRAVQAAQPARPAPAQSASQSSSVFSRLGTSRGQPAATSGNPAPQPAIFARLGAQAQPAEPAQPARQQPEIMTRLGRQNTIAPSTLFHPSPSAAARPQVQPRPTVAPAPEPARQVIRDLGSGSGLKVQVTNDRHMAPNSRIFANALGGVSNSISIRGRGQVAMLRMDLPDAASRFFPGGAAGAASAAPLAQPVAGQLSSVMDTGGDVWDVDEMDTDEDAAKPTVFSRLGVAQPQPTQQRRPPKGTGASGGGPSGTGQGMAHGKPGQAPRGAQAQQKPVAPQALVEEGSTTVEIFNLHPEATEEDIKATFGVLGTVLACKLMGEPSGLCEITFKERKAAEDAVATYNGMSADGNILEVKIKPKGIQIKQRATPAKPPPPPPSLSAAHQRRVVTGLYADR